MVTVIILITTICQKLCLVLAKNNHIEQIHTKQSGLEGLSIYKVLWKEGPRIEQGQPLWGADVWYRSMRRLFQHNSAAPLKVNISFITTSGQHSGQCSSSLSSLSYNLPASQILCTWRNYLCPIQPNPTHSLELISFLWNSIHSLSIPHSFSLNFLLSQSFHVNGSSFPDTLKAPWGKASCVQANSTRLTFTELLLWAKHHTKWKLWYKED